MAQILPMRPLRFAEQNHIADLVAPPYDVINAAQREELGRKSRHNIAHVDLPEGDGDGKYTHAAELLGAWKEQGVLRRAERACMMRYEQTFVPPGGGMPITRRGFFGLVRGEPYEQRIVLPHERTLSGPKEDRFRLMRATGAALSPVFFLYNDPSRMAAAVLEKGPAGDSFTTSDGIIHRVATIDDPIAIATIAKALANQPLFIADGHHRYETTLRYTATVDAERAGSGLPSLKNGTHRYVLGFFADAGDPDLMVFPTHRWIHGLAAFDKTSFLASAAQSFDIELTGSVDSSELIERLRRAADKGPSVVSAFVDGSAALLTLNDRGALHPALNAHPEVLRKSDVVVLHTLVLEAILGITREMQATQSSLGYYKNAPDAMDTIRRGEGNVVFLMNPTPVDQVVQACEAGAFMPQKSTYFYPKVLTGLAIHELNPDVSADWVYA